MRLSYPELQVPAELRIMDGYRRTPERLFPAAGICFARLYGSKPASCVFSIIR